MNKKQFFAICYLLGMFLIIATLILAFLVTFTKINFNEDKYIHTLLTGGLGLILISPSYIFHNDSQNPKFTYTNFRGYFLFCLGVVCVVLYILLRVFILK
jgi:hypothetical protein